LLVEAGTPQSCLACQPNRLHCESVIGMNISRATPVFAEQLPIQIANAGRQEVAPPSIPMKKGFAIRIEEGLPYDGQGGVLPGGPGEQRRKCDDGTSQKPYDEKNEPRAIPHHLSLSTYVFRTPVSPLNKSI